MGATHDKKRQEHCIYIYMCSFFFSTWYPLERERVTRLFHPFVVVIEIGPIRVGGPAPPPVSFKKAVDPAIRNFDLAGNIWEPLFLSNSLLRLCILLKQPLSLKFDLWSIQHTRSKSAFVWAGGGPFNYLDQAFCDWSRDLLTMLETVEASGGHTHWHPNKVRQFFHGSQLLVRLAPWDFAPSLAVTLCHPAPQHPCFEIAFGSHEKMGQSRHDSFLQPMCFSRFLQPVQLPNCCHFLVYRQPVSGAIPATLLALLFLTITFIRLLQEQGVNQLYTCNGKKGQRTTEFPNNSWKEDFWSNTIPIWSKTTRLYSYTDIYMYKVLAPKNINCFID